METPLYEEMYRLESSYWWFKAKREIIFSLLDRFGINNPECSILDVGCGCGYTLFELSRKYKNAIGLDYSDQAIEFGKKRGVTVKKGALPDKTPFENKSFDAILLLDVLEHVDDDAGSVKTCTNLLKPGGIMIATVPAHPFLWAKRDEFHRHKRRYTLAKFTDLFNLPDLEKLIITFYNSFLFIPIAASRLLDRLSCNSEPRPDIHTPPGPINYILERIFAFEKHFIGKIPMPTGVSLLAVCREKNAKAC